MARDFEVVVAFFVCEEIADVAYGLPEGCIGTGSSLSDQGLDLGERCLDRVQVWAVGWQGEEPDTDALQVRRRFGGFVAGEVVEDDDVSGTQRRDQLGLDVEIEELAVDRAVDDPGRVEPVMKSSRDEGLGLPVTKGGVIDQTRPAWCPSGGLGHVGLERCFVDETYACQHVTHEGLPVSDPDPAGQCHIRPLLLDRPQVFFCVSGQSRARAARPSCGGPRRLGGHAVRPPDHQESVSTFP